MLTSGLSVLHCQTTPLTLCLCVQLHRHTHAVLQLLEVASLYSCLVCRLSEYATGKSSNSQLLLGHEILNKHEPYVTRAYLRPMSP